jgi:hypothetical protein
VCHSVGGRGIAGGEEPRPWMLRTRVDGVVRRWREGELSPHAVRLHQSCGRKVQVPYGGRQSEILSPCSSSRWRGCALRARGCGCCGAHEKPRGKRCEMAADTLYRFTTSYGHVRWVMCVRAVARGVCIVVGRSDWRRAASNLPRAASSSSSPSSSYSTRAAVLLPPYRTRLLLTLARTHRRIVALSSRPWRWCRRGGSPGSSRCTWWA